MRVTENDIISSGCKIDIYIVGRNLARIVIGFETVSAFEIRQAGFVCNHNKNVIAAAGRNEISGNRSAAGAFRNCELVRTKLTCFEREGLIHDTMALRL